MATEKMNFKFELYATAWNKFPYVSIQVGNKVHYDGEVNGSQDKPTVITFQMELEEGKDYDLKIILKNKDNKQTIVQDGKIIKDMLLHIKSVEIDDIDIGGLVYEGMYTPEYPEPWATQQKEAGNELPQTYNNVTKMGHNGTWKLTFSSPFYMWLLENLY